ncbi:hypothetical protein T190611E02C_40351 [Tenacibaculum sp. 190524A05c]|uniref:hypothetical protein n=1 Tax=Tenacibaculum platacis TaxID=3137852 RepID=UPI0031FB96F2
MKNVSFLFLIKLILGITLILIPLAISFKILGVINTSEVNGQNGLLVFFSPVNGSSSTPIFFGLMFLSGVFLIKDLKEK